jgi:hypothetical protein
MSFWGTKCYNKAIGKSEYGGRTSKCGKQSNFYDFIDTEDGEPGRREKFIGNVLSRII